MGAPVSGLEAGEQLSAEDLLGSLRSLAAGELRKHATLVNYWIAIRRGRELPAIRDLDPLEISDAGPSSLLLELSDGGQDAELRHVGEALKDSVQESRIGESKSPSLLASIGAKLGIIAISRNALAFEDELPGADGPLCCSVSLLPFSSTGTTVDFVHALVSLGPVVEHPAAEAEAPAAEEPAPEPLAEEPSEPARAETEASEPEAAEAVSEPQAAPEPQAEPEPVAEEAPVEAAVEPEPAPEPEPEPEPEVLQEKEPPAAEVAPAAPAPAKPGFSKVFDALAGAKGFFGTVASAEPEPVPEPVAEQTEAAVEEPEAAAAEPEAAVEEPDAAVERSEPVTEEPEAVVEQAEPVAETAATASPEPVEPLEGSLQSKLAEVRSKADEVRLAKLRAEAALVEGLSAAYDFALDAENQPEEYLKLVEAQGLKIQLRSPMKPVVKLAFDGSCDDSTIKELEAVMAWALKQDLPRGTLAERIEAEGGIGAIVTGGKRAA
jgi:hypothetical protein